MISFYWFKDGEGEPRVWMHGINYSRRDEGGTWAKHGAQFLYIGRQQLLVSWKLFTRDIGIQITFDTTDDYDIGMQLHIPFITSLYFGIVRAQWVLRLLGLTWKQARDKPSIDWSRTLGFAIFDGALWVYPWVNRNESSRGHRDSFNINPANILLGRRKYSKTSHSTQQVVLSMPEGDYPLEIELYTATWKRPRWPFVLTLKRADIEVLESGGVPIPGKGENAWDMDDDAVFGMSCQAATVDEAIQAISTSVERTRRQYGWETAATEAQAATD